MTKQVSTNALCEMMVCPNCTANGDKIRELDNLTCTWLCSVCGWQADGRDFDPGLDDRIDELDELLPADIGFVPETGVFSSGQEPTTKWSGPVDDKIVTVYCSDQQHALFQATI